MLKYLHIENIAVIEQSNIEFTGGFNVLTGETGAGKSIVIDSINAVLGERTSRELIRSGCATAEVSAVFGELNSAALEALRDNGYSPDEDGNLLIRRTLSLEGKGTIRINGSPATAAILREIGKYLVNIHGQHDNQSLLNPDNHCGFIDAVAHNTELKEEYYSVFKRLNAIRRELNELETDEDEKLRRRELLKYQVNELEAAAIKPGEFDELKRKSEIVRSYEKTMTLLLGAYRELNGDDEAGGAVTLINSAHKKISELKTDTARTDATRLENVLCELDEICTDIRRLTEDLGEEELDINTIEERLDFLRRLMLKYGNSETAMLEFLEQSRDELSRIDSADKRSGELEEQLEKATERIVEAGAVLTESRKKAAAEFERDVCNVLTYLNMPDVRFTVDIKQGRYNKNGCDSVEFLISANAGEEVRTLHKIASGGELSRVMLAIKSVLSDMDTVATLIFDEIDSGISGRAAGKVGVQLRKVSGNRQVVCVTHLAQIAAAADNHLLIEKNTEKGRTYTVVRPLSYNERIGEIARIMSGTELTDNLFNSAKELLDRSMKNDNL